MKRSEMVDFMVKTFNVLYKDEGSEATDEERMSKVLKGMEELEMFMPDYDMNELSEWEDE